MEKLLVTSNFSFSHSVFKRLVSQGRQKVSLCGNGLRLCLVNLIALLCMHVLTIQLELYGLKALPMTKQRFHPLTKPWERRPLKKNAGSQRGNESCFFSDTAKVLWKTGTNFQKQASDRLFSHDDFLWHLKTMPI